MSTRQHELARPRDELGDQRVNARAVAPRQDVVDRDAVPARIRRRHVDAAARRVDAEVLPEIGELERAADRVRLRQRRGVADAVQMQQQAADRVRRASAVVEQLGTIGVPCLDGVLREGIEEIGEQRCRESVLGKRARERSEHLGPARRRRLPDRDRVQVGAEGGEVGETRFGRRVAFVGDVVGRAREAVDRDDRRTKLRRAEPGGHREVFIVIDAHRLGFSMRPRSATGS